MSYTEDPTKSSSSHDAPAAPVVPVKRKWYYTTLAQALVVGAVAFLAPGMYNALSNLGAGGLASADTWNKATALLFGLMCVTCVFGGIFINQFGLRWSLSASSIFYTIYAASLYENSRSGNEWFLIFANALQGIGAGVFFAAEGAVVIGYPEPHKRGRYISIWIVMRNLGPVVGGAILLSLNKDASSSGSVSLNSYLVFVGIMCSAPFVSLLLAAPEKVQRSDGSKVVLHKTTFKTELKASWRFLSSRKILLLIPLFFVSWFSDSMVSNYSAKYLSVRARALSSFLSPFAGNIGAVGLGWWLDSKFTTRRNRALLAFSFIIIFQFALWIWTSVNIKDFLVSKPKFDWSSTGFGRAYALIFFWFFEEFIFQSFLYWLTGTLTHDLHELVHVTGIVRGIEGAGQAVAYGIEGSGASPWVHIGLNVGLVGLSIYPAYLVIKDIPNTEAVAHEAFDEQGNKIERIQDAVV
ncbi:MFS general substrate transporter [Cylindrobasidium torrendii FP15055 ss-10]|uniref:MFS general substrate transporter n=1 Tax=Cylindrobasidium torrendii FP15055 ss-10 TaxID=1314674 RepID=A0A0D7BCS2_9AGAR|nr:MFS general substrate transporter [Cylindrobasidium torrendii FP15055 ss-10]